MSGNAPQGRTELHQLLAAQQATINALAKNVAVQDVVLDWAGPPPGY